MVSNSPIDEPFESPEALGTDGRRSGLARIGPPPTLLLAGASVAIGLLLAALRLTDAPNPIQTVGQAALVVAFVLLTVRDYRVAVTLTMIELATAGAGGRWTVFPAGISGRIVLDAIVVFGALVRLATDWRKSGRMDLGRYGRHLVVVAALFMLIWLPLGLFYGNGAGNAVADGDGYAFLAFVIVFIVLLREGEGAWVRDSLLVACAVNAIFLVAVFLVALSGIAPLFPDIRGALQSTLGFEGAVGYLPSGAWRIYFPTSLYLQVGVIIVGWRLLSAPRPWLWLLYAVLLVDLGLSYTRGFWICTVLGLAIVVILASRTISRTVLLGAGTAAIVLVISIAGLTVGFSVPDYLLNRASSTLATRPIPSSYGGSPAPAASTPAAPEPSEPPIVDELGSIGNQVRIEQARVLMGHIAERPLLGSGFGAIAADYAYGDISRYEISYLDLAYKTGLLGALLFLSVPVRFLIDALRGVAGRLMLARGVSPREASVPLAIVASILAVSASNPYLFAAYGLMPIIAAVAWLDPMSAGEPVNG